MIDKPDKARRLLNELIDALPREPSEDRALSMQCGLPILRAALEEQREADAVMAALRDTGAGAAYAIRNALEESRPEGVFMSIPDFAKLTTPPPPVPASPMDVEGLARSVILALVEHDRCPLSISGDVPVILPILTAALAGQELGTLSLRSALRRAEQREPKPCGDFNTWWSCTNNEQYFSGKTIDGKALRQIASEAYRAGTFVAPPPPAPASPAGPRCTEEDALEEGANYGDKR